MDGQIKKTESDSIGFKLYANCVPVKGAVQALICDLQQSRYIRISNEICSLLDAADGFVHLPPDDTERPRSEVGKLADVDFDVLNELVRQRFGFWCRQDEQLDFPKLSYAFHHPSAILNAIIDFTETSNHDVDAIVKQLDSLGCKAVQLRFFFAASEISLRYALGAVSRSSIVNVEILVKDGGYCEETISRITKDSSILSKLIIHSAKENRLLNNVNGNASVYMITNVIDSSNHCGFIFECNFHVSLTSFSESMSFNSCLYRKISIDSSGEIKNCPAFNRSYGNVVSTNLSDVCFTDEFARAGRIRKDQIEVCKDCEFRYVCLDCRAFVENPDDIYSKPLKCGYNPYTCEWEEWSENPLKQNAITHYGIGGLTT